MKIVDIGYFSDILCVWAYVAQARVDELRRQLGERVRIQYQFINLFGSTETRIGAGWKARGGYRAFGDHVREVGARFPYVEVNPSVWSRCQPRSSATGHLFLKAVQNLEAAGRIPAQPDQRYAGRSVAEEAIWRVRLAFFRDAIDIGAMPNLLPIAAALNIPQSEIQAQVDNGAAMASLCRDMEAHSDHAIAGSPTFLFNEGRQKLYGNVGYRVIEANVRELLEQPSEAASWC